MKATCTNNIKTFKKGCQYDICPTVGGYQVTDENDETTGFPDEMFEIHFEIK